ncbi:fumarylacetoacetate hydrolase domain-containing protein 2 [Aplysia californica]|uniref:Fumarylacetoacetate hydrolase domain-containing protein 2 n=1 Tax=Aplysia californica TaxID=6500 RepID=A0ABM0JBP7_APLCA|nr:fumarylacetoacetate hydrolase domain-containing protein 2 [Aplysia californica]
MFSLCSKAVSRKVPVTSVASKLLRLRCLSTMRFVQFDFNGRNGLGVELSDGGNIVDLSGNDSSIPSNMREFIGGGQTLIQKAAKAVESGENVLQRSQVKLLAPILNPDKLLCIGMNYVDHCAEQNLPVPTEPIVFSKFNSSITGPTDDVPYPDETKELDWEVELAIVIGKEGKNISKEEAMQYVFGYTAAHDVSARDWQMHRNGGQFLIGKSMDGFCPLGPAIVMKEDLNDPHNLKVWTRVNGVTKQDSSTNQLVFKTEELVAFLSRFFTLKPGDTILTGTPPGVGVFRKPPEFLKRGDVVEVGIENIGTLTNKIV